MKETTWKVLVCDYSLILKHYADGSCIIIPQRDNHRQHSIFFFYIFLKKLGLTCHVNQNICKTDDPHRLSIFFSKIILSDIVNSQNSTHSICCTASLSLCCKHMENDLLRVICLIKWIFMLCMQTLTPLKILILEYEVSLTTWFAQIDTLVPYRTHPNIWLHFTTYRYVFV